MRTPLLLILVSVFTAFVGGVSAKDNKSNDTKNNPSANVTTQKSAVAPATKKHRGRYQLKLEEAQKLLVK